MSPRIGSVGSRSRRSSIESPPPPHGGETQSTSDYRYGVPRKLRPREPVTLHANAEFTIQIPGGAKNHPGLLLDDRRHRAAFPAECSLAVLRRLEGRDLVLARHPFEAGQWHRHEGRKSGPVMFTAHRALAVRHHLERSVDIVFDVAAQTGAVNDRDILDRLC